MIIYCPTCDKDISGLKVGVKRNHLRWCGMSTYTQYRDMNWEEVQKYYDAGFSFEECKKKFNCTFFTLSNAVKRGDFKKRTRSENSKLIVRRYGPNKLTDEQKEKLRQIALNSPHRRLKKKTFKYKGILLDSTWELELAQLLDSLDIKWLRPTPIKWVDNNNVLHNYFPDFYLPDYDVYLDPKNPYAAVVQSAKLNCLKEQYKNIIFLTKEQISKEYLASVLALSSKQ